jgi:hypothetical protein
MSVLALSIDKLSLAELQEAFLAIRQRVLVHARFCFRGITCQEKREDYIAESIAVAWRWFLRLAKQGKDARRFPSVLCRLCRQGGEERAASHRAAQAP